MGRIGRALTVLFVVLPLSPSIPAGPGGVAAQDAEPVRVEGRVMWRAGQTVVVAPDGAPSVNVDVSQVPQDQHSALREGDRVVVLGSVPNERNRVIAASVERKTP